MYSQEYKNKIKFLVFIITILLLWFIGRYFHIDSQNLQKSLGRFPVFYTAIIFIILYVIVTFFIWLSKDIFRFVAAILFGVPLSTLFIWIAEIINAYILFHFSYFLGRDFIADSLNKPKFKRLDEKLSRANFFWLFMFRITPLVPFRFLDIAIGLTDISFKRYLMAVILGSPLRILWLQYVFKGVGESIFNNPYALIDYLSGNKTLFIFSLIYLVFVVLVALKIKRKD